MRNVARREFKFNFLKQIVVRVDINGVLEAEMEKILLLIKPYLKSNGFSRYTQKNSDEFAINLADSPNPSLKKIKGVNIHSFINENMGYTLDISNKFICLNINSTKYEPFDKYSMLVSKIVDLYKENIDFTSIYRVGIRKINVCMLENKANIKKYFSEKYFGYFDAMDNIETFSSNRRDTFAIMPYKGNISCNIDQGKSNEKCLYKITLDIDIYTDDEMKLDGKIDLSEMNEIIFKIYIDTLSDNFKNSLLEGNENMFTELIGVETNE